MGESLEDRIARMDTELRILKDKNEIMELEARTTMAYDRLDIDLLSTSWDPDATVDFGYMFTGAVKDLMEHLRNNAASWGKKAQYHIGTTLIQVDGDIAHAQIYVIATYLLNECDENGVPLVRLSAARYLDRLRRTKGEWRILHRTLVSEWGTHVPSQTADAGVWKLAGQGLASNPQSRRDKSDPVYSFLKF